MDMLFDGEANEGVEVPTTLKSDEELAKYSVCVSELACLCYRTTA
jgi:hypothetical protein